MFLIYNYGHHNLLTKKKKARTDKITEAKRCQRSDTSHSPNTNEEKRRKRKEEKRSSCKLSETSSNNNSTTSTTKPKKQMVEEKRRTSKKKKKENWKPVMVQRTHSLTREHAHAHR